MFALGRLQTYLLVLQMSRLFIAFCSIFQPRVSHPSAFTSFSPALALSEVSRLLLPGLPGRDGQEGPTLLVRE